MREPHGALRLQRAPGEIGALHADFPPRRRGLQLARRRGEAVSTDTHSQRGLEAGLEHGEAVLQFPFPERGGVAVDREKRVEVGERRGRAHRDQLSAHPERLAAEHGAEQHARRGAGLRPASH